MRVPCLMLWPGQLAAGTVNDRFLMTIDLLPTVAGRVGAPLPDRPIDGRDVWPLLAGTPAAAPRTTATASGSPGTNCRRSSAATAGGN